VSKKGRYKVGIIGCGAILPRHLEAINECSEDYELVALCDNNKKRLDLNSKEFNVPGFLDYKDMLKEMKGSMNFVSVCTPNSLHYQQAIDSIRSGCHVLVEKPIDFTSRRAFEIVNEAKKHNVESYAVLQVRYNNVVEVLERVVDQKLLGTIRSVSLIQRWQRPHEYFESWRADKEIGGRTLYEVGIHYVDIMQWVFGVPKVIASASFSNKHKHVSFEDTVFAILEFPDGASGSLEVTIASEPSNLECSLSIMGSLGYIKLGGRALDTIEQASFLSESLNRKWDKISRVQKPTIEANSYGLYRGSCPNHSMVYKNIALGEGILLKEAIGSIKFIEEIYKNEIQGP